MGYISTDFCLFNIFLETLADFKPVNPLNSIADLQSGGHERFLQRYNICMCSYVHPR